MHSSGNKKITVGLLIGSISSNYHEGFLHGVNSKAKELGIKLITFSGGPFHATNPLVQSRDSLFQLVLPEKLDAVIIPFSSLTRYMDEDEIQEFIDYYRHIPVVNIGTYKKGLINIMPNYTQGLSRLMEHFIVLHGYRRIALIRGPKNHDSSNLRTQIYCDQLKKYNIPIDENLIVYGDMERNSTSKAVEHIISKIDHIDAVIAINSNTTLAMINALKKRNVNIPNDIAFAGMTNLTDEIYTVPSLTLVDENFHDMGSYALDAAYKAIMNQPYDDKIYVDMPLHIGESCGCKVKSNLLNNTKLFNDTAQLRNKGFAAIKTENYSEFIKDLSEYISLLTESSNATTIVEEVFVILNSLINNTKEQGVLIPKNIVATVIEKLAISITSSIRYHRHETKYYLDFLRDIGNMMNSEYDLSLIEKYILSTMDIKDIYINIYEDCDLPKMKARNILAISNYKAKPMDKNYFNAKDLLPSNNDFIQSATSIIVFPLILRAEHYGNLIVSYVDDIRGCAYEAIETLISTTVKNELQIQDLLDAKARFDDIASYDSLTGLPNRRLFQDQVNDYIEESMNHSKGALIIMNVDRFKQVNDTLGRYIGDQLLRTIGEQLKKITKKDNKIARVAEDEFAIILKDVYTEGEIYEYIREIYDTFSEPVYIESNPIYVSLCMGVAIFPSDGHITETLLINADRAMHKAKSTGQNHFVYYDQSIEKLNQIRLMDELRLRNAIKCQSFQLHYQTQVDSVSGVITGMEALIRILEDDGSLVYPNAFIGIAEEIGLINHVDQWVLNQVCKDIKSIEATGKTCPKISVNLSAKQLKKPDLVKLYMDILDAHNISPTKLQIELTERAIIENKNLALKTIQQFSDQGFTMAIDDFGKGYSSLSYIHAFPMNVMKIDRAFINNASNGKKDMAILSTLIHLGTHLGMTVIAEGVETQEQMIMARDLGCHQIQGYFFSKPVPIELVDFNGRVNQ